jgi:DNA-binding CsgD family transcriptional regulator
MLYMSVRTAETHRLKIRRKLDLPKEASLKAFLAALGAHGERGERDEVAG